MLGSDLELRMDGELYPRQHEPMTNHCALSLRATV